MPSSALRRFAFSKGELLLVIAILFIVGSLFLISIQNVRLAAAQKQSANNLREMAWVMHGIAARYEGLLPPSVGTFPNNGPNSTIFFHMMTDIACSSIYLSHRNNPDGIPPEEGAMKTYTAPLDLTNPWRGTLLTSYASNAAVFGLTDGGTARYKQSFDKRGTANHVLFMERFAVVGPSGTRHNWNSRGELDNYLYPPTDGAIDPESMAVPQFGVAPIDARNDAPHAFWGKTLQIGMADGSARTITPDVTRTFVYGDGRTATIWAWACSLDGPLGEAPTPAGW